MSKKAMTNLSKTQKILYSDKDGNVVGLDEMTYLAPIESRIPYLIQIALKNDNGLFRYEASVVLASWGEPIGLSGLENTIDEVTKDNEIWLPHRIFGYETIFDQIGLYVGRYEASSDTPESCKNSYKKLLRLVGKKRFRDGGFASALKTSHLSELLQEVLAAYERGVQSDFPEESAMLLVPMARWSSESIESYIPKMEVMKKWHWTDVRYVIDAIKLAQDKKLINIAREILGHPQSEAQKLAQALIEQR